jgi:hypothetical protein
MIGYFLSPYFIQKVVQKMGSSIDWRLQNPSGYRNIFIAPT